MTVLFTIIHVIVSVFLIFVILIQSSKGAEMGAAFGGSSQTIFGSRGAGSLMSKITTISAVVFMVTSLVLAVVATKSNSVIKKTMPLEQKTGIPLQQGPIQPAPQPQIPQPQNPLIPAQTLTPQQNTQPAK